MSAAWTSRIARPESRQSCGHPRCRRYTAASVALVAAAVAAEFGLAAAMPGNAALPLAAGGVLFTAGMVLAFWPHPHDDGSIEALIEATRERIPDFFPHEWTEEYKP